MQVGRCGRDLLREGAPYGFMGMLGDVDDIGIGFYVAAIWPHGGVMIRNAPSALCVMGKGQIHHAQVRPCMPRHNGRHSAHRAFLEIDIFSCGIVRGGKAAMGMPEDQDINFTCLDQVARGAKVIIAAVNPAHTHMA